MKKPGRVKRSSWVRPKLSVRRTWRKPAGPRFGAMLGLTLAMGALSVYGLLRGRPSSLKGPAAAASEELELALVEQFSHEKPIMDLSVTKDGTVYVMDSKGLQMRSGGSWGNRLDLGWEPSGWNYLSAGPSGVFLTRPGSSILYKADLALKGVKEFPLEGARELTGVAADEGGGAYVSDVGADAIFHVDGEGKILGRMGKEGQVKDPRALCLASDGDLYAVDSGLNQVLRFSADGALKKSWNGPWERPTLERLGVAGGKLYINNHLGGGVWIMGQGGKLEGLCRRSSPEFPMPGPAQLTVGKDGFLYVGSGGIGKFLLP